MTLIVGLRCADGAVLMCADKEQSDQVSKRTIDKIFRISLKESTFLVAGAGRSSIVANTCTRLGEELKRAEGQAGISIFDKHREIIETVLHEIHEQYIWGRSDENERAVKFIITVSFSTPGGAPFSYATDADVLYQQQLYACAGAGEDLAYYFIDKLFNQNLSRETAALLAAFVFREVSRSVSGVGLGTDMWLLTERREYRLPAVKTKELESVTPEISDVIAEAWNSKVKIPKWLSEFYT
jgi:20S proteasome alpha/beta subunit